MLKGTKCKGFSLWDRGIYNGRSLQRQVEKPSETSGRWWWLINSSNITLSLFPSRSRSPYQSGCDDLTGHNPHDISPASYPLYDSTVWRFDSRCSSALWVSFRIKKEYGKVPTTKEKIFFTLQWLLKSNLDLSPSRVEPTRTVAKGGYSFTNRRSWWKCMLQNKRKVEFEKDSKKNAPFEKWNPGRW